MIDEFAEFKNRFPEFMQAVNRVFAVGRTLGVHMILLTQKPAGVVDDKMNANTRFRWCLKVANAADSREMLHHTDAAQLTPPGRAYVQVGEDEVYEQIQSYWSGAPYQPFRETAEQTGGQTAVVDLYGNRHCYEPEKTTGYRSERKEINAVVDYLDRYCRERGVEKARQLWPAKLPEPLRLGRPLPLFCCAMMRSPVIPSADYCAARSRASTSAFSSGLKCPTAPLRQQWRASASMGQSTAPSS